MRATDSFAEYEAADLVEPPGQPTARDGREWGFGRRLPLAIVTFATLFYLVVVVKVATSKEPFVDEGWLASPAYNLAFHGFMGTSVLDPHGSWLPLELKGIQQYTYWVMPLSLLAHAAWYRIFGFGIVRTRLLSAVWGVLALAAWFFIVERITRSALAGSIAFLLVALDFTFLWSAADGRMDMMCVGLGSAGLAAYLCLRERHLGPAIFTGNCLTASSLFTHPNGIVWVLLLAVLILINDRKEIEVGHASCIAPYLALGAGWAAYIAKRPDYFLAQFNANLHLPSGTRGSGFLHPLEALRQEIGVRYFWHFHWGGIWAYPVPRFAIVIPAVYWTICLVAALQYRRTREHALGQILLMLAICFALMTFADTLKAHYYLPMILPIYAAVAAAWLNTNQFRGRAAWAGSTLIALILATQLAVLHRKLSTNPLRDDYRPTVAFLKTMPTATVDADAVFGFELGYDRLIDDARVGLYSGRKPDLLVHDLWYDSDWYWAYWISDMRAFFHIKKLLEREYHPVFTRGNYIVYQLNSWTPPGATPASSGASN